MHAKLILAAMAAAQLICAADSLGQELPPVVAAEAAPEPQADPAALKALEELVKAYRDRPALGVKTTVKIELKQGETKSNGSEIKAEFLFGPKRAAVVKLRGFTCYLSGLQENADGTTAGTLTAVYDGTDHAYFSTSDDGDPYYALLWAFNDLPFPELAIEIGEESIDNLLMQFHPRATYIQPTAVSKAEVDGKPVQKLTLAGPTSKIDMNIDPDSRLIQTMEVQITGGDFVQAGAVMTYRYKYEYEMHDKPLDASAFTFDPGKRQRVDMLASLMPKAAQPDAPDGGPQGGPNQLVGKPAPPFVLSTADGKAVDLADLRGRVVVLDFWASWCGPCLSALPKLHEVARWANEQQLPAAFMTINVWEIRDKEADNPDARLESAKATWQKRNFTLPIAMDYSDETAAAYGVGGIPMTVVIRSDGTVHAVHTGASVNYVDELQNEIREALKAVQVPATQPKE